MEEPKKKYILLVDRFGSTLERNLLSLGHYMKATPTQVLRGELLEALQEAKQTSDGNRIALVGIERKSLRLECPTVDLNRLSDEEANLLLSISSLGERYATFIDRKRLDFGRRLSPENQVFVSVKRDNLPGVVRYKGELPSCPGTMFGVELIKHKGQGTSDGTFRNKRYFTCPANSGVFVGLDKLTTRELSDSKSPKRDENAQGNFKSKLMDTVMPSFLKLKNKGKSPQEKINQALEIDQRVVTFIKDYPVRGTVRYIGREEDASGNMRTIVGLELDKRVGSGTGKWNRRQLFVCKIDFACFVDVENVIREEVFDANPLTAKKTLDKQDALREQIQKDELLAKSMSYDKRTSGGESVKKVRRKNLFKSAEVILAAGESSQTDPTAFIEKQRQMLSEMKNPKSDKRDTFSDGDVDMHDKDRTSQIPVVIEDDDFMPCSSYRDDTPNTDQPGFSNRDLRSQGAARNGSYSDFVTIGKEDYEMSVQKHEVHRAGAESVKKVRRTNSFKSAKVILDAGESSQTDPTAFIEKQRQMLSEMKNPKSDKRDTFSDGDVDMHDKDRTSQIPVVIEDDDFMPCSSYRDDTPNTDQPGFSNRDLRSQGAARNGSYSDFVTIGKEDYEMSVQKHEVHRAGAESVKKVRRTNSFKSAEVILDAGESSQTDPTAFIEKQRQMLSEMKNPKSDKRDTFSDGDVDMHDKDRTSQIPVVIEDDHFMPYSSYRDDRPNTDQPGFSNRDLRSQGAARKGSYSDFVTIGKEDSEMSVQKHEVHRAGGPSEGKTHRTISFNSNDDNKNVVESNQTDATTFVEQQRQTWVSFGEEDQQEENSQTQLSEMEQRVKRMQEQLREKEDELEISERLREQQLTNFHEQQRHLHGQLREKDQQEENLQRQLREIQEDLREKDQQEENSQRQLREIQEQLREKDQQEEDLQRQLREIQEQLREKDQQEENSQRQLREIQEQLREKDQQEENSQRQLREIQEQLREKDQQEENLQRQLREIREQLREKDQQEKSAQRQVTGLERQLRIKDQQVNELQITLSTAQQALSEHQRRQVTPDWVISRDQIQLTDKLLGRGGWGSVVEGKYCGCSVAVKQIHELILSPHNRTLFEREMDVASRCRHPCLLQFVGATNEEGSPLFVTELMESSLRALLEQRPLAGTEVSTISLDVARALNYLHQKKPSPIIHRDISSANVLLWRQGDQWRGKVSDYGTANFMQHTMTVGPGATIYMAPEALTPNQTVKVDVYSFGVLLCEMCIRELPDPERRNQQIAMVKEHLLRALIRRCLQSDPEARPNMEEIIEELEEPV